MKILLFSSSTFDESEYKAVALARLKALVVKENRFSNGCANMDCIHFCGDWITQKKNEWMRLSELFSRWKAS